jgi:23S rRNA pseudouridine955/2504/2580 synthase
MFLHAHRLRFTHPVSGEAIEIESPLPGDLARFVARLDTPSKAPVDA